MRNLMRRYYQSWIVPYFEGTLDARRRAQLEAQLARDPLLADDLLKLRVVAERLQAQRSKSTSDAEPARTALWPGIERRLQPRRAPLRLLLWAGAGLAAVVVWGTLSISSGPAVPTPAYHKPVILDAQNLAPPPVPLLRRHHRSRVFLHPLVRSQLVHTTTHREPMLASQPGRESGDKPSTESVPAQSSGSIAQDVAENSKTTVRTAEEQEGASRFHLATGITPNPAHEDTADAEDAPPPDSSGQSAAPKDIASSTDSDAETSVVTPTKRREAHHHRHSRRQRPAATVIIE